MRDNFPVCSCWRIGEDGTLEEKTCNLEERNQQVGSLDYRDCGFISGGRISRREALAELRRQNPQLAAKVEEAEARRRKLLEETKGRRRTASRRNTILH